jgi:uridine phosphorylase
LNKHVIPESELILLDGRVYHLNLRPDQIAKTIIMVGDPDRVAKVSTYFDKIEHQVNSRELVTHTGYVGGKRLSVVSSGMGTDNVELVMTELDALVNIDFDTRMVKDELTSLEIIRIGTSGCLQSDIPLDAHLVSESALGLDTLMSFYKWENDKKAAAIVEKVAQELQLPFTPYFADADQSLVEKYGENMAKGITITAPGFYAPQGREVRLKPSIPGFIEKLAQMDLPHSRFTNLEMETAGYYALARLLGHKMVSLNALIANRARQEFSDNHEMAVDGLIRTVLNRI